jgi:predicted nucleic acid-binding protein
LEEAGRPLSFDAMIGATALANGLPLYTANTDDVKVPGSSDQLLSPRPV